MNKLNFLEEKMLIKEYLEKSRECLIYPESYYSWQMKTVEEILEMFQDIDINTKEKSLQVRLQDTNMVVILSASAPQPIKYSKPPFTLIIRKFFLSR